MARFRRLEVLSEITRIGLVPIFYHPEVDAAQQIVTACSAGGARVVEFTNRGDNAFWVFSQLVSQLEGTHPDVILGVGSVMDPATAAVYIGAGANLIVSPVLNPDIAQVCNRHKVAHIPGCATPSEISEAEAGGAEIVKLFPGNLVGGPEFIRAIHGPMPWTRIMPTGGVKAEQASLAAWFAAGAAAVGIGSSLIGEDLTSAHDFQSLTERVVQVIAWIQEARDKKVEEAA